jgi:hypothetical protein
VESTHFEAITDVSITDVVCFSSDPEHLRGWVRRSTAVTPTVRAGPSRRGRRVLQLNCGRRKPPASQ